MISVYTNRSIVSGPWGGGNAWLQAFLNSNKIDHVYMHRCIISKYMHPHIHDGWFGHLAMRHERLLFEDKLGDLLDPKILLIAGQDACNGPNGNHFSANDLLRIKEQSPPHTKIILRVNDNDARKGTSGVDQRLIELSKHLDGTIFVSDWLADYFQKQGWKNANSIVVKNGVDRTIFAPQAKFNNGKLNIVSHHWSDNAMKGADITQELDRFVGENSDRFSFTFIGRTQVRLKNSTHVPPLHGKRLGEELGKHDVYVSASRFDPGPNHVLEGLSCGLPTFVHKDGGGCVEFAGSEGVYSSWEELKQRLLSGNFPKSHPPIQDWNTCIQSYVSFLSRLQ